ncbi:unnamed protein product, partial [Staurois parvus]
SSRRVPRAVLVFRADCERRSSSRCPAYIVTANFATLRGPDYKSPDFWGGRPRGGRGAGARHTEELN